MTPTAKQRAQLEAVEWLEHQITVMEMEEPAYAEGCDDHKEALRELGAARTLKALVAELAEDAVSWHTEDLQMDGIHCQGCGALTGSGSHDIGCPVPFYRTLATGTHTSKEDSDEQQD